MAIKNKLIVTALLMSFIIMGMVQPAHAYTFYIDEFSVTRSGSLLFDDPFNNNNPPPSAPNFTDGTSALYFVHGTMGPELNTTPKPGKLTLDSSGAVPVNTPLGAFVYQQATLSTNIVPSSPLGLKNTPSGGVTFSVTGVFDLIQPSVPLSGYGITLSDGSATNDIDDNVRLYVLRNAANQLRIELEHADFTGVGTVTSIAGINLDTNPSHTQIAFTLSRLSTGSDAITGSFYYIDSGVPGAITTFGTTTNIFGDENFTRAQFEAFESAPVPEPCTMLLLGSGLIGLAGYGRKKFFKK